MYVFLSYQTSDKAAAGQVKALLAELGIEAFLAHEDIHVSHEWRTTILEEIGKADLFIPLLTQAYFSSPWCVQESGIAAFRKDVCIVPLSLDGSIPQGFFSHVQSTKVEPGNIRLEDLLPGLTKADFDFTFDLLTGIVAGSRSYRGAEANFGLIKPLLGHANDGQIVKLLNVSAENGQVLHASGCAHDFLPPLFGTHGHLLEPEVRQKMEEVLALYV